MASDHVVFVLSGIKFMLLLILHFEFGHIIAILWKMFWKLAKSKDFGIVFDDHVGVCWSSLKVNVCS